MGKKYQEEEKKNKLEFLNRMKLQYDWDNDELEASEGLIEELAHPDLPAQFPGIELERELNNGATSAMTILEASTEQEAHDTAVNGNLIEPIKQAPSVPEQSVTDIIIIDNDSGTDNIVVSRRSVVQRHMELISNRNL